MGESKGDVSVVIVGPFSAQVYPQPVLSTERRPRDLSKCGESNDHDPMSQSPFPSLDDLKVGLMSILSGHATLPSPVEIMERRPLNTTQSHPSEVVKCRRADGQELQLLCKYGDEAPVEHQRHGHRRGVAYETLVYRTLLAPQGARVPHWYGTFLDSKGRTWLVIEYLDGAVPITYLDGAVPITTAEAVTWQASLKEAARWIALFQNRVDARPEGAAVQSLITYDAEYYTGWARRTLSFAETLPGPAAWLAAVVNGYATALVPMLMRHPTFIHGEYYPGNIMLWRDAVYVLDWESAAIGAGEIDLSCLIEGLETELAQVVIDAYRNARVPSNAEDDFMMALEAATIYLQFRWLGDRQEWTIDDSSEPLFARLRAGAERCGLI